jgi:hypothetical protein
LFFSLSLKESILIIEFGIFFAIHEDNKIKKTDTVEKSSISIA